MQWLLLTYVFHYSLYSVTQINAVQDTERLMEVARVSDNFYFNCWPSLIISYSYYNNTFCFYNNNVFLYYCDSYRH